MVLGGVAMLLLTGAYVVCLFTKTEAPHELLTVISTAIGLLLSGQIRKGDDS
jgi:hypothetical protein